MTGQQFQDYRLAVKKMFRSLDRYIAQSTSCASFIDIDFDLKATWRRQEIRERVYLARRKLLEE